MRAALLLTAMLTAQPAFGADKSCKAEVGHKMAMTYVHDCRMMSPATHPPCNEQNPCWMMWGEVVRSCDMGVSDEKMCTKYRGLMSRHSAPTSHAKH